MEWAIAGLYLGGSLVGIGIAYGRNRSRIDDLAARQDKLDNLDARMAAHGATLDAVLRRLKRIEMLLDRER